MLDCGVQSVCTLDIDSNRQHHLDELEILNEKKSKKARNAEKRERLLILCFFLNDFITYSTKILKDRYVPILIGNRRKGKEIKIDIVELST